MAFRWLTKRRRRAILTQPFPTAWDSILRARIGHFSVIGADDQHKLRAIVQIMLVEKKWEGCRGFVIDDECRVTIAGQAALLVLGFDGFYWDNVLTILVYPSEFVVDEERALGGGATLAGTSRRIGEAHSRGPVIVSWKESRENAKRPGYGQNLVFHEFAHQLDILNGAFDGTPLLRDRALAKRWAHTMREEYGKLRRVGAHDRNSLLDPYGATDPAEFFAVAVESFFDAPRALRSEHADLYDLLRDYFRQDPANWKYFEKSGWRKVTKPKLIGGEDED